MRLAIAAAAQFLDVSLSTQSPRIDMVATPGRLDQRSGAPTTAGGSVQLARLLGRRSHSVFSSCFRRASLSREWRLPLSAGRAICGIEFACALREGVQCRIRPTKRPRGTKEGAYDTHAMDAAVHDRRRRRGVRGVCRVSVLLAGVAFTWQR